MRKSTRGVYAALGLALAGRCAGAAVDSPPASADRARAVEVQRSIQQRFWDDARHLYVGKSGRNGPAMMWSAGIAFSALDAACRYDPATYQPVLSSYFQSLDRYWDRDEPGGGYEPAPTNGSGHDKYYDDNAWMAITFAEGYDLTGSPAMLERARQTTDFVLRGWDDQLGGGIWWHEAHKGGGKNTCVNAPAAVACLALARRLQPSADAAKYRAEARRIVDWTRAHLQNPDGRFADHVTVATGKVAHFSLTYNTALMIRAELMLARQTGSAADEAEAEREARAADAFADRRTGGYHEQVKWSHLLVEADLAVARQTADRTLADHVRRRARASVDVDYAAWQAKPSAELIDVASLARELWLLVDDGSDSGQAFWRRSDGPPIGGPP